VRGLQVIHSFLRAFLEGTSALTILATFLALACPGNPVTSSASQETAATWTSRLRAVVKKRAKWMNKKNLRVGYRVEGEPNHPRRSTPEVQTDDDLGKSRDSDGCGLPKVPDDLVLWYESAQFDLPRR
jgi:hypothetical protein